MKMTYDSKTDVAYIRFARRRGKVVTLTLSEDLNIDLSRDGEIYGIELLSAKEQLFGPEGGKIEFVDPATGKTRTLSLTA